MNITKFNSNTEHVQKVKEILSSMPDSNYLLMLSGGNTPVPLYNNLSFSFNYPFPKDIALVDERWGNYSQHDKSNELIIKNSGLLGRIRWEKNSFHPVLCEKPTSPEIEAATYEKELSQLFEAYEGKVVAIMGMGENAHTAGMLPNSEGMDSDKLFVAYESGDEFKYRLTVTAKTIMEKFSKVILLLNTEEKYAVFRKIMDYETDARKYPALIYKDITDLEVFVYRD